MTSKWHIYLKKTDNRLLLSLSLSHIHMPTHKYTTKWLYNVIYKPKMGDKISKLTVAPKKKTGDERMHLVTRIHAVIVHSQHTLVAIWWTVHDPLMDIWIQKSWRLMCCMHNVSKRRMYPEWDVPICRLSPNSCLATLCWYSATCDNFK